MNYAYFILLYLDNDLSPFHVLIGELYCQWYTVPYTYSTYKGVLIIYTIRHTNTQK